GTSACRCCRVHRPLDRRPSSARTPLAPSPRTRPHHAACRETALGQRHPMATLIRFLIGLAGGLVAGIGVELLFVEVSDTSAPHHDSARIIQATPASQPASSQPAGIRSPSSNIHRAPPQAEFRRVIADATSQPYAALDRAAALGEPLRTLAFGQLAHEWV